MSGSTAETSAGPLSKKWTGSWGKHACFYVYSACDQAMCNGIRKFWRQIGLSCVNQLSLWCGALQAFGVKENCTISSLQVMVTVNWLQFLSVSNSLTALSCFTSQAYQLQFPAAGSVIAFLTTNKIYLHSDGFLSAAH